MLDESFDFSRFFPDFLSIFLDFISDESFDFSRFFPDFLTIFLDFMLDNLTL